MISDGKKEIIVFRFGFNPTLNDQNELIILDSKKGEVLGKTHAGKKFTDISFKKFSYNYTGYCYDLNNDGKNEILIGNSEGIVRMFDGDPKVIATSDNFKKEIVVSDIADLDGDRFPEVVCKTADNRLIILNHQLTLLKDYKLNPESGISVVRSKGKSYLLITRGIDGRREYNLLEFYPVGIAREAVNRYGSMIQWLLAVTLIILVFLFFRYLFLGQQTKRILYNFLEKAGLFNKALILKNNGKIIRLGSDWEELLNEPGYNFINTKYTEVFSEKRLELLFNALKEIFKKRMSEQTIDLDVETKYRLTANFIPLIRLYFIILIDLADQERLHQVKAWIPVAQRLAHGIKNPLTTMKLNAEELWDLLHQKYQIEDNEIDDSFQVIIEQADLLKKMK